ncbi:hypothetical protein ACM64Y_10965 [Novispirillum sp. DQ9]|uniref:hypothetical protein n=1 Tax=Novispirillum sp. DQ9 TaxID=3398612 RepID=UPI003C7A51EB
MRSSFEDLQRVRLARIEQSDDRAAGRSGTTVTGGRSVTLALGQPFRSWRTQPRLVVECDFSERKGGKR